MAETYPLCERIMRAVAATLAAITTANGYRIDVPEVVRPKRQGIDQAPDHLGVIWSQDEILDAEDYNAMSNPPLVGKTVAGTVNVVIRLSDSDTTNFDEAANIAAAEVQRAIMDDPTQGGLAITTRVGNPMWSEGQDATWEGVAVPVEIDYRTPEDDPFTRA